MEFNIVVKDYGIINKLFNQNIILSRVIGVNDKGEPRPDSYAIFEKSLVSLSETLKPNDELSEVIKCHGLVAGRDVDFNLFPVLHESTILETQIMYVSPHSNESSNKKTFSTYSNIRHLTANMAVHSSSRAFITEFALRFL